MAFDREVGESPLTPPVTGTQTWEQNSADLRSGGVRSSLLGQMALGEGLYTTPYGGNQPDALAVVGSEEGGGRERVPLYVQRDVELIRAAATRQLEQAPAPPQHPDDAAVIAEMILQREAKLGQMGQNNQIRRPAEPIPSAPLSPRRETLIPAESVSESEDGGGFQNDNLETPRYSPQVRGYGGDRGETHELVQALQLPAEQKLESALRIARASAQQTRAVATALDQAKSVALQLQSQVNHLEGQKKALEDAKNEALDRVALLERNAEETESSLVVIKYDFNKFRFDAEDKLQTMREEILSYKDHEGRMRQAREEQIEQLRERAPQAERALANEHLRHGEELAVMQLELLDERERLLTAQNRLEEERAAQETEMKRCREEYSKRVGAAQQQARERAVAMHSPSPSNAASLNGDPTGWAAYERNLHSSGTLVRSTALAVADHDIRQKIVFRNRMHSVYDTMLRSCDHELDVSLMCIVRCWRKYIRTHKSKLARVVNWHSSEWQRGVLLGWYRQVRGKWRTRTIIAKWSRMQFMKQSVGDWFQKWVTSVTCGRVLRKQISREASYMGKVLGMEREVKDLKEFQVSRQLFKIKQFVNRLYGNGLRELFAVWCLAARVVRGEQCDLFLSARDAFPQAQSGPPQQAIQNPLSHKRHIGVQSDPLPQNQGESAEAARQREELLWKKGLAFHVGDRVHSTTGLEKGEVLSVDGHGNPNIRWADDKPASGGYELVGRGAQIIQHGSDGSQPTPGIQPSVGDRAHERTPDVCGTLQNHSLTTRHAPAETQLEYNCEYLPVDCVRSRVSRQKLLFWKPKRTNLPLYLVLRTDDDERQGTWFLGRAVGDVREALAPALLDQPPDALPPYCQFKAALNSENFHGVLSIDKWKKTMDGEESDDKLYVRAEKKKWELGRAAHDALQSSDAKPVTAGRILETYPRVNKALTDLLVALKDRTDGNTAAFVFNSWKSHAIAKSDEKRTRAQLQLELSEAKDELHMLRPESYTLTYTGGGSGAIRGRTDLSAEPVKINGVQQYLKKGDVAQYKAKQRIEHPHYYRGMDQVFDVTFYELADGRGWVDNFSYAEPGISQVREVGNVLSAIQPRGQRQYPWNTVLKVSEKYIAAQEVLTKGYIFSDWKLLMAKSGAEYHLDDVEEEFYRRERMLWSAALRFDDKKLYRQVFYTWQAGITASRRPSQESSEAAD